MSGRQLSGYWFLGPALNKVKKIGPLEHDRNLNKMD